MLRRSEMNAVDAASVAAARFIPQGSLAEMEEAACFYVRGNGFFPSATTYDLTSSGCVPANDPNASVLEVNWPPRNGTYAGDTGFVEVVLSSSRETFFIRLAGLATLPVTSSSVSANGVGSQSGGQLVALDPTSCGAGKFRGNGTVDVEGSIYVNSDGSGPPPCISTFDDACSGTNGAFRFEGSNARLITPQLSVRGTCGQNSNPYPTNCGLPPCGLTEGAPQIDDPYNLVTPTRAWAGTPAIGIRSGGGSVDLSGCDQATDTTGCTFAGGPGSWYELYPGTYYAGWAVQRTVCLHEGFYYFAGGGIQVTGNGRIVTLDAGDTCAGVAADVQLGGQGRILLYGTDGPNCPATPAAGDRRCQGVFSIEGQGGFQAKGYEETNTVVRGGITDADYHRLLMWQSQYKEDGVTRTSRTWPGDTNFDNDKIRIAGTGYLNFWGTIYAPKSLVEIQGQGSGLGDVAGVEILAWRFDVGGNGSLDMPYDPAELSGITFKGLVE
jgi:hypothetical protein